MNNKLIEQYNDKAFDYYKKGDYITSINYYEKIIGLGFESSNLYNNLGICHFKIQSNYQALIYFSKAIQINAEKNNDDIYCNIVMAYTDLKRFKEGIIICKEGLTHFPNSNILYNLLGNLYMYILRSDLAEESFLKAIELNPNDDISYSNLGQMYSIIGEFDKGKQFRDKGFEILHNKLNK